MLCFLVNGFNTLKVRFSVWLWQQHKKRLVLISCITDIDARRWTLRSCSSYKSFTHFYLSIRRLFRGRRKMKMSVPPSLKEMKFVRFGKERKKQGEFQSLEVIGINRLTNKLIRYLSNLNEKGCRIYKW